MDDFGAKVITYLVLQLENPYNDLDYDIYNCLETIFRFVDRNPYVLPYHTRNSRLIKEITFRLIYYLCIKKTDKD